MNDQHNPSREPNTPTQQRPGGHSNRVMSSSELLQGATEIFITHGEETYRLRLTRNGKLILHK